MSVKEKPIMNQAEAVTNFAAWLTTRDKAICLGAEHDCGEIACLVGDYIEAQGFGPVRDIETAYNPNIVESYGKE